MSTPSHIVPPSIIKHYNLPSPTHTTKYYLNITKGMYGLPQAGRLAHDDLSKLLNKNQFFTAPHTPGIWIHHHCPISFILCVDDFMIKYVAKNDSLFLINLLTTQYRITTDWSGTKLCGFHYIGIIRYHSM